MLLVGKEPESPARKRAVEMLALVLHHPTSELETKDQRPKTKDKVHRLMVELVSNLPPDVVAAVQEREHARNLETMAAELLEVSQSLRL